MKRLSESERAELTARWNEHPGMRHLGVQVDLSAPEEVRVYVDPVLPFHRGGMGTEAVNGAIISGVFDLAIGLVGHFHTPGERSGTAQLHIHFLRPVLGDRFGVVARVLRAGRSLVFAEADLHDEEGRLCGRCDGIVAVVGDATAEPAGPVPL